MASVIHHFSRQQTCYEKISPITEALDPTAVIHRIGHIASFLAATYPPLTIPYRYYGIDEAIETINRILSTSSQPLELQEGWYRFARLVQENQLVLGYPIPLSERRDLLVQDLTLLAQGISLCVQRNPAQLENVFAILLPSFSSCRDEILANMQQAWSLCNATRVSFALPYPPLTILQQEKREIILTIFIRFFGHIPENATYYGALIKREYDFLGMGSGPLDHSICLAHSGTVLEAFDYVEELQATFDEFLEFDVFESKLKEFYEQYPAALEIVEESMKKDLTEFIPFSDLVTNITRQLQHCSDNEKTLFFKQMGASPIPTSRALIESLITSYVVKRWLYEPQASASETPRLGSFGSLYILKKANLLVTDDEVPEESKFKKKFLDSINGEALIKKEQEKFLSTPYFRSTSNPLARLELDKEALLRNPQAAANLLEMHFSFFSESDLEDLRSSAINFILEPGRFLMPPTELIKQFPILKTSMVWTENALRVDGCFFQFILPRFQNSSILARIALEQNPRAFAFLPEHLQKEEEFRSYREAFAREDQSSERT